MGLTVRVTSFLPFMSAVSFETPDLCERLALSIPRRIQQVLRAKGKQQNIDIVNRLTALNHLNCCVVLCKVFLNF